MILNYSSFSFNAKKIIKVWLKHPRPDAWLRIISYNGAPYHFNHRHKISNQESLAAAFFCYHFNRLERDVRIKSMNKIKRSK